MPSWPEVTRLIPHRPPILMVEEIVSRSEGELVCRGTLPSSTPFLTLELAAQTAAVMAALEADEGPERDPAVGYLAAIRDARFLVSDIPSGRPVLATVHSLRSLPPLRRYSVNVILEEGSIELVSATLSTYRPAAMD